MVLHTIMNGKRPPEIPLLFLPNNKSGNGESAYLDQPALQGRELSPRIVAIYRKTCITEYICSIYWWQVLI